PRWPSRSPASGWRSTSRSSCSRIRTRGSAPIAPSSACSTRPGASLATWTSRNLRRLDVHTHPAPTHTLEKARPVGRVPGRRQAPMAARVAIRVLGAVAPTLAARLVERLWFTPPRAAIPESVKAELDRAEALELTVHGRRVAGWAFGADGPTVLLVHGWGGTAGQLIRFAAPLVARGLRVVAYDAPGHGFSDESRLGARQSSFLEVEATLLAAAERHGPFHAVVAH